jgi:prepilin-type N-terminal cleavage/methylation domain-containing protein
MKNIVSLKRQHGKWNYGFSLIELMTSVAIIGILSSISIPNYISYRQKAEYTALQQTLNFLMDAQDIYFMENDKFFPEKGQVKIKSGQGKSIPELNFTFNSNHKHQFSFKSNNKNNGKKNQINSYWIDVSCDFDFDGNGKKDKIRLTTLYKDGLLISNRAFRQFQ